MQPRDIKAGIREKYKIGPRTADSAIERVQAEMRHSTGFSRMQLQELSEKAIVRVLKNPASKDSDVLKAVEIANTIFGIARQPEDNEAHEKALVAELSRRIQGMNLDELDEFKERIISGKLDSLFENPTATINGEDLAPLSAKKRRRSAKSYA